MGARFGIPRPDRGTGDQAGARAPAVDAFKHSTKSWSLAALFCLFQSFGIFVPAAAYGQTEPTVNLSPGGAADDQSGPTVEDMARIRQNPLSGLRSLYSQY